METIKMSDTIISFWNDQFDQLKPRILSKDDFKIETDLDDALVFLANHAKTIVEVGVGSGYGLLICHYFGKKASRLIGFDPSINAIDTLRKTCQQSKIMNLELSADDHHFLSTLTDASIDGFIALNVLDVLTPNVTETILEEIKRTLRPGGYIVLKFNFLLTSDIIARTKAVQIADNMFAIDGVLRVVNKTLDEWKALFDGYEVIREGEYERLKDGPKDRVLLLKKPL